jgi:ADP-ribose pyrophosphatase YjhB (NUDIX family)
MNNTFTIGSHAIILDDCSRVLLCHRCDYDLWNLPGGGLGLNEAPWECVIREVKEEVGLDVEVIRLAGIYSKRNEADIVFSFICQIVGGEITLTDEADQIKYFPFEDIPKNTPPRQIERIRDALTKTKEAILLKIQTGSSSADLIKQGRL